MVENIFLFNPKCHFRFIFLFVFFLLGSRVTLAQFPDSTGTGYLLDPAEEYWPVVKDSLDRSKWQPRLKHIPIRRAKGYVGLGLNVRETYENFKGYLWGLGSQDKNGYFLHRILAHADVRWNRSFRLFTEIQSSTLTHRNGGPRPVQDLNPLAVNQLFGEVSVLNASDTRLRIRLGKQALHYGIGTLLDVREANVRRTFAGGKAILEKRNWRVDAFYMTCCCKKGPLL